MDWFDRFAGLRLDKNFSPDEDAGREAGSHHSRLESNMKLSLCVGAILIGLAGGSSAVADAYYTVTDLGADVRPDRGIIDLTYANGLVTNPVAGISLPFERTYTPLPTFSLPPGHYLNTPGWRNDGQFLPTTILEANANGYVIGAEAMNPNSASPSSFVDVLYKRNPDGTLQDIRGLIQDVGAYDMTRGVHLNNQDLVLAKEILYDIHAGTYRWLRDLVPADSPLIDQVYHFMDGVNIDDEDRIIVESGDRYLLLTPPTTTPEPTTLSLFGSVALGLGVRHIRRSRMRV